MQKNSEQLFYSKVLLFGEYSLIVGSMALSIPFQKFCGRLVRKPEWQIAETGKWSNFQLDKFADYLAKMPSGSDDYYSLDLENLGKDIKKGLVFQSNIPLEYGLGSSGALVAAVFNAYGKPEVTDFSNQKNLAVLKKFLAKMESCFHGRSSGLDPLISLLNKPLLIAESGEISITHLPEWSGDRTGALFLVDSGSPGETQSLVERFIENSKDDNFMHDIQSVYSPLVNACINAYQSNNIQNLHENMILLSGYQFKKFNAMIPDSVKIIWKQGLESGNFTLKLCGSGGGGMVLGFTQEFERIKQELKDFPLTEIHRIS